MKAMLLIGLQVDLLPGGGAEVPGSEGLAAMVGKLLPVYGCVAVANFWFPVSHRMFAANHPWRKPGQPMEVGGTMAELQNFWCIQGSFGAEMVPGIDLEKVDFTANMGTQPDVLPHSAFFDDGKRNPTGLADFLREKNVTELHLAGMPFETTVKHTALDAAELSLDVKILANACRATDALKMATVLAKMEGIGIENQIT